MAKSSFLKMRNLFTSWEININTRLRLLKCYIWTALLYCSETWTINKRSEDKLQSLEMWVFRRILKIPWTDKKTNAQVLQMIGQERTLWKDIKKRKVRFLGHLLRHQSLQKQLLEGMIKGKRKKGRQRLKWMDNITKWTHLSYADCAREAQDRDWWRFMVVDLLEGDDT